MFRKNDLILLLVVFSAMGVGIALPEFGRIFAPYPLYFLIVLLFFSFLKINFLQVFSEVRKKAFVLFILCLFKLCIIPISLFLLTRTLWPEYAVPVLLLSGISTGVVAPFISSLLEASTLLVLMMVVVSSLLAPFSLPTLVSLFVGQKIEIPFLVMVKVLAMVVFLPAVAVILLRYLYPTSLEKLRGFNSPYHYLCLPALTSASLQNTHPFSRDTYQSGGDHSCGFRFIGHLSSGRILIDLGDEKGRPVGGGDIVCLYEQCIDCRFLVTVLRSSCNRSGCFVYAPLFCNDCSSKDRWAAFEIRLLGLWGSPR